MRCPKCRFITSETNKVCPRCGEDLSSLAESFGPFYKANEKEVILKDTLITAPPFISEPMSLEPPTEASDMESAAGPPSLELELPGIEPSSEQIPLELESLSTPSATTEEEISPTQPLEEPKLELVLETPKKKEKEDLLKELEEVLEEDSQG
ncbi:hypothetical protein [Thermosulfurimonas dismutans]|uniref:Uncharacterized protein n=1 Tax=Thermosulfurimonas dismutans TaxID=999894 RepID=A0A179D7J7_9BACT|nr:hypothetical protein [Thermosulfurimonas dismutans]OAQ21422.1 hypothetical protein TDIS_0643 [Thermosulfurimonas dismutans]